MEKARAGVAEHVRPGLRRQPYGRGLQTRDPGLKPGQIGGQQGRGPAQGRRQPAQTREQVTPAHRGEILGLLEAQEAVSEAQGARRQERRLERLRVKTAHREASFAAGVVSGGQERTGGLIREVVYHLSMMNNVTTSSRECVSA